MSSLGKILILDDEPLWHEVYSSTLMDGGYEVFSAENEESARNLLRQSMFHVLIMDMRLSDADQDHRGGMQVLDWLDQQGQAGGLETIFLTAYSTIEQMRAAFSRYQVFDFLDKAEFTEELLLNVVSSAFQRLKFNSNLVIELDTSLWPDEVASLLNNCNSLQEYSRERLEDEWQSLLMRLFSDANSVLVKPQQVLKLEPLSFRVDVTSGPDKFQTQIVQIGPQADIAREYEQIGAYFNNLAPLHARRTPLLGGIAYSLPNLAAFNMYHEEVDQLRQRIDSFEVLHRELDEQLETAGHQINMPLKQVKAILGLLLAQQPRGHKSDVSKQWLSRGFKILEGAPKLIERTLGLIRLQAGNPLEIQRYDVVNCVRRAIEGLAAAAEQKELSLQFVDPVDGFQTDCDPDFLTYAIEHVLDNAIKFTARGFIEVKVEDNDGWVKIQITDTGRGIAEEDLTRIYDHGVRIDPTSDGWGIGLHYVKQVLEQHHGRVEAASILGQGTTFTLLLPKDQS